MPRRGKNIYFRKCDRRWEGRVKTGRNDAGKTRYKYLYGKSYREVMKKMEEFRISLRDENNKRPSAGNFKLVSLSWLESVRHSVKLSSYNKYRNSLNTYILPFLGQKECSEINDTDIKNLFDRLKEKGRKDGKGLSSSTMLLVFTILNKVKKYIVKKGCRVSFSTDDIKIRKTQKEIKTFTKAEQEKLLENITSNADISNLGIVIAFYTGMRIGEICALRWEDIDFGGNLITVRRNTQRVQNNGENATKTKVIITTPKSPSSVRSIPITPSLLNILLLYRKSEGYVLSRNPEKITEPRTLQYRYAKILENCGIRKAGFHTLRHSFATSCVELGFDTKSLSEILGHSNVNITLNKYVHPTIEQKARYMNLLSEFYAVRFSVSEIE